MEVADDFSAYNVFGHRHTGEMLEQLGIADGGAAVHAAPAADSARDFVHDLREAGEAGTAEELEQCLRDFYAGKPWVRVFGAARLPQIKFSLNTNYCDIGFALAPDGDRAVLVSCLDNLLKGAAGQAVQNMNLMFG